MWKWIMALCVASTATLSAETKVLAITGSAREGSVNKKLVDEAAFFAREKGANVTVVDQKDFSIPFYDADLESMEGMPAKAKQLRQLMVQSNVVIIASPEYNGSLSALLKNTIDWLSRSEEGTPSRKAFLGKTFILLSASPGPGGGARGLTHLRSIIENVGGTVAFQQFALPNAYSAFDEKGHLKDPNQQKPLKELVQSAID